MAPAAPAESGPLPPTKASQKTIFPLTKVGSNVFTKQYLQDPKLWKTMSRMCSFGEELVAVEPYVLEEESIHHYLDWDTFPVMFGAFAP